MFLRATGWNSQESVKWVLKQRVIIHSFFVFWFLEVKSNPRMFQVIVEHFIGTVRKCPIFVSRSYLGAPIRWKRVIFYGRRGIYIWEKGTSEEKSFERSRQGWRGSESSRGSQCLVYYSGKSPEFRGGFLSYPGCCTPSPPLPSLSPGSVHHTSSVLDTGLFPAQGFIWRKSCLPKACVITTAQTEKDIGTVVQGPHTDLLDFAKLFCFQIWVILWFPILFSQLFSSKIPLNCSHV